MPDDVAEALDYVLKMNGKDEDWIWDGEDERRVESTDNDFIQQAKLLAEWVMENCK